MDGVRPPSGAEGFVWLTRLLPSDTLAAAKVAATGDDRTPETRARNLGLGRGALGLERRQLSRRGPTIAGGWIRGHGCPRSFGREVLSTTGCVHSTEAAN